MLVRRVVLEEALPREDFTPKAVKDAGHPGDEGPLQDGGEKRASRRLRPIAWIRLEAAGSTDGCEIRIASGFRR
jgi:hypothetical protein